jgi:hypothetical protein
MAVGNNHGRRHATGSPSRIVKGAGFLLEPQFRLDQDKLLKAVELLVRRRR